MLNMRMDMVDLDGRLAACRIYFPIELDLSVVLSAFHRLTALHEKEKRKLEELYSR